MPNYVPDANAILKTFKQYYPKLNPKCIFKTDGGYIVSAPNVKKGIDYSFPYYFVDTKLTKAVIYNLRKREQFFDALDSGPIWEA